MQALDSANTLLLNIGINTFASIVILMVIFAYNNSFTDTYEILLMRNINILILIALFTDTIMWILNGRSGSLVRILSYANLIIYFLSQIAVTLEWLRYAYYRIYEKTIFKKQEVSLVLIPLFILALFVLTAPLNGWCFYLDEHNYFHRGIASDSMSIVLLAYLFSVSVMALTQYKKEVLIDRRKELLTIAFFVLPPFLGGTIQIMFYGISWIWPCAVISSLLIIFNKGEQAMFRDPLTGLNNRRNIERFLITYENRQNYSIALIMLDVNDFKYINDHYGHSLGDYALLQIADILRKTFNNTPAFLGRYGGDEFVVIIPQIEENLAREAISKIKNNINAFNKIKQLPFELSISFGYSISTEKTDNRIELFKEADRIMYQDKAKYHGNTQS
ncbi:GGDEF domain-containing protein [Tissierella creatinini]|nr:GGDEF domain-containing protein [Tissierella creatinini]TJX63961.1 GGDEF domain-containing protein [Soehngenia saccharolytica]